MTRRTASLHMAEIGVCVPGVRPCASRLPGRTHNAVTCGFASVRPCASHARPSCASPRPSLYREGRTHGHLLALISIEADQIGAE